MHLLFTLLSRSLLIFSLCLPAKLFAEDYASLYEDNHNLEYADLIVEVRGFKLPTRTAFLGWVIMNGITEQVNEIHQQFIDAGIYEKHGKTMPLHLVLLQGTDWVLNGTSLFTLPTEKNVPNMIRTVKFIQQYVEPELGPLIPVSGKRSTLYNQSAGGAPRSKHMEFCALDLVPAKEITRTELHRALMRIYNKVGREHSMGLGLYSGVRFHIDTCGYRSW
ncbi:D-Ala-D-Ala carboxypeptidase family metallohydrolase [Vibrio agarivorans]|uniref:D-Ala-D-Ala carboxypeptidase family metallohydrolase n=1 Tax=Vibrio agarivorans TaxID=153622 RepID=UPI0025B2A11E|nr:D-Ala-D-Ala carboxypeptidase family metallohydrolase [Vibrio agarivorans]MDN3661349.1 D-Ala-D-Ala carboxypeptidase family metallohydrolase [Vibrio agarivorans]